MSQIDEAAKPFCLTERNEFIQSGKRALCGAVLFTLALIVGAILAVLSLPPSSMPGPEPDLRLPDRDLMPVALAASASKRDAPEPSVAIGGPGLSLAYAPTIPQDAEITGGSKAGPGVASPKRVHIQQGFVVTHLARHGKRSHTVLAHVAKHHRRAAAAVVGRVGTSAAARIRLSGALICSSWGVSSAPRAELLADRGYGRCCRPDSFPHTIGHSWTEPSTDRPTPT
jgi:hypothetical protein